MPEAIPLRKPERRPAPPSERVEYVPPTPVPKRVEGFKHEEKVIVREAPTEIASHIGRYFLNAAALNEYVRYLEDQIAAKAAVGKIEMPTGESFATRGLSRGDVEQVLNLLKQRLSEQEDRGRVEKLRGKISGGEAEKAREALEGYTKDVDAMYSRFVDSMDDPKALEALRKDVRRMVGETHPDRWQNDPSMNVVFLQANNLFNSVNNRLRLLTEEAPPVAEAPRPATRELAAPPPKNEAERIQRALNALLEEEDRTKAEIEKIEKGRGVGFGLRKLVGRLSDAERKQEARLASLKSRLEDIDRESNLLQEDLQMETYRERAARVAESDTAKIGRKAKLAPESLLAKEAREREDRLAAQAAYGDRRGQTAESYEEEIFAEPGKKPEVWYDVDLSELEAKEEEKEEAPIPLVKKKPVKVPPPPKEIMEAAEKGRRVMEAQRNVREIMSSFKPEEAQRYVPNAKELWDLVDHSLTTMKAQDRKKIENALNATQMSMDAPSTKFVYDVARYQKALAMKVDDQLLGMLRSRVEKAADDLGIANQETYLLASDPAFRDAMSRVPHADKFLSLIHEKIGFQPEQGDVAPQARNYLAAMGEYRKAVEAGDVNAQNAAWEKVSEMNDALDIAGNALVQSAIGNLERPKDVLRGTKQRREAVRRSNARWSTGRRAF